MRMPIQLQVKLRRGTALLVAVPLLHMSGCDSGPSMGKVSGVATNSGVPVSGGTVVFFPTRSGPMAQGELDREGRYLLTTKVPNDGALVGDYFVAVVPPTDVDVLMSELKPGQMQRKTAYDNIPKHVRNHTTSGLSASVTPGSNTIDFDFSQVATT